MAATNRSIRDTLGAAEQLLNEWANEIKANARWYELDETSERQMQTIIRIQERLRTANAALAKRRRRAKT